MASSIDLRRSLAALTIGMICLSVGDAPVTAQVVGAPRSKAQVHLGRGGLVGGVPGKAPVPLGPGPRGTCGSQTLTQSTNSDVINDSVWCGDLQVSAETSLARAFTSPEDLEVRCVTFGVQNNQGGDWPTHVRILQGAIDADYGSLVLLGEADVIVPAASTAESYMIEFAGVNIAAGTPFIVELNSPSRYIQDGGDNGLLSFGCNNLGQSAPSYIRAPGCDLPNFSNLADLGFGDRHVVMTIGYSPRPCCLTPTQTIVLRSGQVGTGPVYSPGSPGQLDSTIKCYGRSDLCGVPLDFVPVTYGCGGPPAHIITPYPLWGQQLECDPEARWINWNDNAPNNYYGTPSSALYCQPFTVNVGRIDRACLTFCWSVDDLLGDPSGPGMPGVYVNGNPLPISGGNYATGTTVTIPVGFLTPGVNYLQVYQRDLGCAVSGVIYSARFDICGQQFVLEPPQPECCGVKPTYTDPDYSTTFTGQVMVTTGHSAFPSNPANNYAVRIFNIQGHASAPTPLQEWNPSNFRYSDPSWTTTNLGAVFGATLDNAGNIYVAHSSSYGGLDPIGTLLGSTSGSIYKIANGAGTPTVFFNLPSFGTGPGPGIGNVSWDCGHNQLFASNFMDGRIYRISATGVFLSSYDHATGSASPILPAPTPGYAPLGNRVWAVRQQGDKVYYSVWNRDFSNFNSAAPLPPNQIWSVRLNASGDFINGKVLEFSMPPFSPNMYSEPVTDISFSQSSPAKMLLAERSMGFDSFSDPLDDARLIELEFVGGGWVYSAGNTNPLGPSYGFPVGNFGSNNAASAGGADYDADPNGRIWVSGDTLRNSSGVFDGGTGVIPFPSFPFPFGATVSNSIFFDYDNSASPNGKNDEGDIVIPCERSSTSCAAFTDVSVRCEFGPGGVPTGNINVFFSFTNNSGVPIQYIHLPAGVLPSVINLGAPVPPGGSAAAAVTLTSAPPNSSYCFSMIFTTTQDGQGCQELMCITTPNCIRCPADYNQDGVVTSQDFFDFLLAFFAGNADINGDGQTTSQDFFDFLVSFFEGC